MLSRRSFLHTGMNAAVLGLLARHGMGRVPHVLGGKKRPLQTITGGGMLASDPVAMIPDMPPSIMVGGLPFAEWYTGDSFTNDAIPFHGMPGCGVEPPAPTEEVEVAVIGGGISGLATAYMLRQYNPVVFELRDRFGGSAQGESWMGTEYSLGNAYVITPDAGTFLEGFYSELGLDQVVRVDEAAFPAELNGQILLDFLTAPGQPPEVVAAFEQYAAVVQNMANVDYPEIPLPAGKDNQWILDLDRKSFRQDIEDQMGMPIPDLLAASIQAYCYSSFAAGWEEISAAGGWNFLAAEEFGRWVFPGGTSYMTRQMWKALQPVTPSSNPPREASRLRAGCIVSDVRLVSNQARGGSSGRRVQVTWVEPDGSCRSLLAKKVAMCCPKLTAKQILHDLSIIDPPKLAAMERLKYRAYVVVNVLLDAPVDLDFYDIFLLDDGTLPRDQAQAQQESQVIDMLSGHYSGGAGQPRSVLTLYWPLPFDFGRWTLYTGTGWDDYAEQLVPQIKKLLTMLEVPVNSVRQVRMTRWGHALPINSPGLIADGTVKNLRQPIDDRIFFINQDNWALPAVENCLLDAEEFVPQIAAGL